jgi:hypothetical protein
MVNMNRLSHEERCRGSRALVEGNSIRATVRMTGVAKKTIAKLLGDVGTACSEYQDRAMRNLSCKRSRLMRSGSFIGCNKRT